MTKVYYKKVFILDEHKDKRVIINLEFNSFNIRIFTKDGYAQLH